MLTNLGRKFNLLSGALLGLITAQSADRCLFNSCMVHIYNEHSNIFYKWSKSL